MKPFQWHIILCTGSTCGGLKNSPVLKTRLIQALERVGLRNKVQISQAKCLHLCSQGPNLVIYPDDVWYSGLTEGDIDRIVDRHLVNSTQVQNILTVWKNKE